MAARWACLTLLLAAAACAPVFDRPNWQVGAPRLLAVRGTPAEVAPGATVTWDALVAAPDGTVSDAPLDWSLCDAPKPAALAASVSPVCLSLDQVHYLTYAMPTVTGVVPGDACRLFGPDLPPRMGDEPQARPRDPDVTGGYYQPLRADLGDDFTVALQRIRCALAGASMAVAVDYAQRYTLNQHPQLTAVDPSLALDAVPPGAAVTLTARWDAASREVYPVLDLATGTLVDHHESLRVTWFATAGSFAAERTGRDEDDAQPSSDNTWTAPTTPGPVHLWVVLRDSRGGVDWRAVDATVGSP